MVDKYRVPRKFDPDVYRRDRREELASQKIIDQLCEAEENETMKKVLQIPKSLLKPSIYY